MRGLGLYGFGIGGRRPSGGGEDILITVPYNTNSDATVDGEKIWTGMFGFSQVDPAVVVPSEGDCYALHYPDTFEDSLIYVKTPTDRTPVSVWGYPQWFWTPAARVRLDQLADLWIDVDWSWEGSGNFNLLVQCYPGESDDSDYSDKVIEVGTMLRAPAATVSFHESMDDDLGVVTTGGIDWNARYKPDAGSSDLGYYLALPDDTESDQLTIRYNMAPFIRQACAHESLDLSALWLKRMYFGIEPVGGGGETTVTRHSLSYDLTTTDTHRIRIVPNGEGSAFVIAPHDDLGAIAYELTFANGGDESTPGSSIGAPFGGWRWTGTHHLASVTDDPTDPIATLHQDIGSVDSAMQANFGSSLYGGHYHGGIVLTASDMPDLTTERYVSAFGFGYTATITWPTEETASVVYGLWLHESGNLAGSITYTSDEAFTRVFLSMMIGTGFDQYSIDAGETFEDASATDTYALGGAWNAILRQSTTGYEIEIYTDQTDLTNITNEIINNGSRLKHYVRKTSAGGPLGTVSMSRFIAFKKTDPDPVPAFDPIIDTFDGSGDLPAGYTRTHGPNGGTTTSDQVDGVWQVRANSAAVSPNRWVRPLTGVTKDGVTEYQVEIDYNSIQSNTGMVVYVTKDGSGSTASGNQLPFSGGTSASALNLGSNTPTTATITFSLPSDTAAPHLAFDASNIANRGVNISEIRITEIG